MSKFRVGDVVNYKITGGYFTHGRDAYVFITGVFANTHYQFHDLDTNVARTMKIDSLDKKGILWKTPLGSSRSKVLAAACQNYGLTSNLVNYLNSNTEVPMNVNPVLRVSTPTLNLVSTHELQVGQCIQTNSGHYLAICDSATEGTCLLNLSTMQVRPLNIQDLPEYGVLRTVKVNIEA